MKFFGKLRWLISPDIEINIVDVFEDFIIVETRMCGIVRRKSVYKKVT